MVDLTMGGKESSFADIIWMNEPISSTELSKRSEELLGWKKSTSFTVLKRLCQKGIFQNQKGSVSSLISRDEFYAAQSETFIDVTFGGSLLAFLAAYTTRKALTEQERESLQRMIEEYEAG